MVLRRVYYIFCWSLPNKFQFRIYSDIITDLFFPIIWTGHSMRKEKRRFALVHTKHPKDDNFQAVNCVRRMQKPSNDDDDDTGTRERKMT